ncbi:MAG: hypothetical protein JO015_20030 [Verrucomicrobia bacterium]|nr:hypothetical protein [Verrucomicrobiota bacterium]
MNLFAWQKAASERLGRRPRGAHPPNPGQSASGICVLFVVVTTMLQCVDVHAQALASSPLLSPSSGNNISKVNFDADAGVTFIGSGHAHQKNQKFGSYDEVDSSLSLLSTFQTGANSPVWRAGLEWERYWFSPDPVSAVPSALESLNLRLGADLQLSPAIFARVDVLPGFYGQGLNRFSARQFNVPVEIGASYVYSDRLYFIAGAEVNYELDFPVFPAAGFLWRVNDKITINGILPKPDAEYKLTDGLTLHAGGEFTENTYRMNGDFGRTRGVTKLDNAIVQFDEIRIGAGFAWKVNKTLSLDLEAGAVPYRRFDYNRADYKVLSTSTAPYLAIDLSAKF